MDSLVIYSAVFFFLYLLFLLLMCLDFWLYLYSSCTFLDNSKQYNIQETSLKAFFLFLSFYCDFMCLCFLSGFVCCCAPYSLFSTPLYLL